jgi:type II secretory pathway component PulM
VSLWILALNLGLLCLMLIGFVAMVSSSDPLSYQDEEDLSPQAILAQVT